MLLKNIMIKIIVLFLFIFQYTNISYANTQSAVVGSIANKCSYVLETVENISASTENEVVQVSDVVEAGITGFLTGLNLYYSTLSNDKFKNLWADDFEDIYPAIMDYCKKNLEEDLMDASMNYFLTLPDYKE